MSNAPIPFSRIILAKSYLPAKTGGVPATDPCVMKIVRIFDRADEKHFYWYVSDTVRPYPMTIILIAPERIKFI